MREIFVPDAPCILRPGGSPRVTHFHDCADAGFKVVQAAREQGLEWGYLPPDAMRPAANFQRTPVGALRAAPYFARHVRFALATDVFHAHFATVVDLLRMPWMPKRPYVLTLHGTDIRELWRQPGTRDMVQRAIDGAAHVYYANLDTADNAIAARADAEYLPITVQRDLPVWSVALPANAQAAAKMMSPAGSHAQRVIFTSRWDESKGVKQQLAVAKAVTAAFPDVVFEGLDQGPGAVEARRAGVQLRAPMPHAEFVSWLATAHVLIGQSAPALATTELEGMAIGPALVRAGSQLLDADAPVLEGATPDDAVDLLREALTDPIATSARLAAPAWVRAHHGTDSQVARLSAVYRDANSQY